MYTSFFFLTHRNLTRTVRNQHGHFLALEKKKQHENNKHENKKQNREKTKMLAGQSSIEEFINVRGWLGWQSSIVEFINVRGWLGWQSSIEEFINVRGWLSWVVRLSHGTKIPNFMGYFLQEQYHSKGLTFGY